MQVTSGLPISSAPPLVTANWITSSAFSLLETGLPDDASNCIQRICVACVEGLNCLLVLLRLGWWVSSRQDVVGAEEGRDG